MKSKRVNWREELLDTTLYEGAMDKIGGMSDSQFKDFINANPGAANKAKKIRDKAKSATPSPTGTGPQLPKVPRTTPSPNSIPTPNPNKTSDTVRNFSRKVRRVKNNSITKNVIRGLSNITKAAFTHTFGGKSRLSPKGKLGLALGLGTVAANALRKDNKDVQKEEMMGGGAIANNVGDGKIAGTKEAGDDPIVKKKKRYVYGGRGSRKMWMT